MTTVSITKTIPNPSQQQLNLDLQRLLQPWGGISHFLRPGDKVLIKPNVGCLEPADSPQNTSVQLVEAVARLAWAAGAGQVWVGESCIIGGDTAQGFRNFGYDKLPERCGVQLIDLKQESYRKVALAKPLEFAELAVFERALAADIIINLPKLKTIIATPISVGLKNLKGLLPDFEKKRCHHSHLQRAIVDISQVIKPALTIVDGLIGSSLYQPLTHNILLAGDNGVAVDAVAACCMGVEPEQVPYLRLAEEQGLGPIDLSRIHIAGESPESVQEKYALAQQDIEGYAQLYPNLEIAAGQACSGCVNMIDLLVKNAIRLGVYEKWQHKLILAIGPTAPLNHQGKTLLCLGNCLQHRHNGNYIPGCPIMSMEAVQWLKEHEPE